MPRLQGKVALITGAASGLGEGIAKFYSREGCAVIIADIADSEGQRVAKEINDAASSSSSHPKGGQDNYGRAIFTHFDCTQGAAWKEVLQLAISTFGQLDIVVNNAGTTFHKKPSVEVTEAEFDKVIAVNTKSIYHSVVEVMPYMAERRAGVYINTSSVAGMRVRPGQVFYGGTKGFVNTVTQGLAAEWGPFNIRVNSICPLRSPTGLLEKFSGVPDSEEERERFAMSVPLRRMGDVDAIAHAAVYLASDEASFVSGVNFPVDGGRLAV
ncbi:hypothetical protein FE257_007850 [Aspergillus nanangensis]|uniref:Uncharacterized protein n=1 Tax=Aspergillus nanangensis TaxID=2582783 RepID=A0AAD4CZ15_ASPNN|nr:hypothetical protein FE257_007850 [Aspergillus nanangensis]